MALADREYMRDDERGWRWTASTVLMVVLTACFLLQLASGVTGFNVVDVGDAPFKLTDHLALQSADLKRGYVWELLTFQFLHASWWHLIGNLMGIWFIGRFVEMRLGRANFLKIYFAGGILGGVLQGVLGLFLQAQFGVGTVGASAGIMALFAAFAMLDPYAQFLLWFLLPVRAQYLLWASLALSVVSIVFNLGSHIAHAAHLGGLLTGMAFIHWQFHERSMRLAWRPLESRQRKRELVRAAFVHASPWRQAPETEAEVPPAEFISREVDPILDKISAHGIQSLTEHERKILEAARKKMAK